MSSVSAHLSEDDRHRIADGTMDDERRAVIAAHLASCWNCKSDVAHLTKSMDVLRRVSEPVAQLDALWPAIHDRIEQGKVVSLALPASPAPDAAPTAPRRKFSWLWLAPVGVAAAVVIALFALPGKRSADERQTTAMVADTGATLVSVVDSSYAYEREAQALLDKLELQRALLRPDAAQTLDHDLHVVDVAIAELKDAVARDPANPALRQLLAASYRQKVDLLKRASNAS
jgi:anti-sigma factor RsiW